MTERSRLSEQIKMEADEVLFDSIHFDTRLKSQVRERAKRDSTLSQKQSMTRRWPWLQLSMVAAVFAVVIIGSHLTLPGQRLTQSAAPTAPSSAPPKSAEDSLELGSTNKLANNAAVKSAAPAAGEYTVTITATTTTAEKQDGNQMMIVVADAMPEKTEYKMYAKLPTAPATLKTAEEALEELRQRPLAPEEAQGQTVTITKVELVQFPPTTVQGEKGELCYLFTGSFETGAPFSRYVYAEKGKTGVPN